ncbi:MAG: hypothetical protein CVV44_08645 [Spirochaetae bacterium HGW-Spirochaetae-1]|jgi:hypothetical protein|nr:MAG: hypothetical protein CVV44_08645 [Spirochaetae bacterium HGW-Spirochaetae-1]
MKAIMYLFFLSIIITSCSIDNSDPPDAMPPSLVISSAAGATTANFPIPVTFTFSETVTGFSVDDISVTNAAINDFISVNGATYTANLYPDTDPASVTVNVAEAIAQDNASNDNTAASEFSIEYDGSDLTLTITSSETSPSNAGVIPLIITFSEEVIGFTADDIIVSNCTRGILNTSDNIEFTMDVTPSADGEITIDVNSSIASDALTELKSNNASLQFSLESDRSAPQKDDITFWDNLTNGYTTDSSAILDIDETDFSEYKYKVDNDTVWSTSNDINTDITVSEDGIHTVQIIVKDKAGNWQNEDDPKKVTFLVGTPDGTETYPYLISTLNELQDINNNLTKYYAQINDIDASVTSAWNSGEGFVPIGSESAQFAGSFDGNGYCINNLYINRTSGVNQALWGYINASGSVINVHVRNCNIAGDLRIAGLIGTTYGTTTLCSASGNFSGRVEVSGLAAHNYGVISRCFSEGTVATTANYAGGLVLWNSGTIINSYSRCSVSTTGLNIGGLSAVNWNSSIQYCYSTGSVSTGSSNYGAFIGLSYGTADYYSCFWDSTTSGLSDGVGSVDPDPAGVTGYPTELIGEDNDMTDQGIYSGWDFTNIWAIDLTGTINNGYPYLKNNIP